MMKRGECFQALASHIEEEDIVVAVYSSAFDWIAIRPHPLNYIAVGAMGLATSHALGLALGRPDKRVIVLDGDGSLLMNLGGLVTVAEAAPANFVHLVAENGAYEANGGHPIPGRDRISFAGLASAAGYRGSYEFSDLNKFKKGLGELLVKEGPIFVDLKVESGGPQVRDYGHMHGKRTRDEFRAALNKR